MVGLFGGGKDLLDRKNETIVVGVPLVYYTPCLLSSKNISPIYHVHILNIYIEESITHTYYASKKRVLIREFLQTKYLYGFFL